MKKLFCFLCLLLSVLLLCGCSKQTGKGQDGLEMTTLAATGDSSETTAPEMTAPETTVPETTVPETAPPTEPTLPQIPVTEYPEVRFEGQISAVPINDTSVVICSYEYEDAETDTCRLYLMDLLEGTCSDPYTLGELQTLSHQRVSEGKVLVEDGLNDRYLILDETLHTVGTIDVPAMYGWFTRDMSLYYYLYGQTLMAYDTATGQSASVEFTRELPISYLSGYDDESGLLLCNVYTDPYSYDSCNAVLDMHAGELLVFSELGGYQQFCASGVVTEGYDVENDCFYTYLYVRGAAAYCKIPGSLSQGESSYSWAVQGSDYIVVTGYDEESMMDTGSTVYRYGDDLSISNELSEVLSLTSGITVLPDGSWLCYYYGTEDNTVRRICPDMFAFETVGVLEQSDLPLLDSELMEQYAQLLEGPALSEELAQVRTMADEIEEEFGITILLSAQCAYPAEGCEFPMVTTDQVEWMNETWYIADALNILRRTLELYPEGFFGQFRDNGNNGILVLLVEDIQSANNAIGVSYYMSNWYPIAVDITSYDLMSTYCHELWHATENFITDHDYEIFNDGTWEEMNPSGFWYSYDTTMDYIYETEWTYFDGWYGTGSYFVDSYARTNAKEDRARLMEYIMAYEEETRSMMEAPALYEKAGFMCDAIRKVFDTTGWENVWWERFH